MACCSGGDKERIAGALGELGEGPEPGADNADTEDTSSSIMEQAEKALLGVLEDRKEEALEKKRKAEAEALAALPWYSRAYARCC